MYKALILSDSHGLTDEISQIKARHHADINIHCGDSELQTDAPQLSAFTTVRGNCDWTGDFPLETIIEVGGLRFFISHGHMTQVKSTLMNLQYRALELDADIACFGHTHIAYAENVENCLFINPGSIRFPNYIKEPSYVLLEWEDKSALHATFYHVNGEEIHSLPYEKIFSIK